jgi:hypothetical protein
MTKRDKIIHFPGFLWSSSLYQQIVQFPGYLDSVKNAHLEAGLTILLNHNPLPGLTGRLCYYPCQGKCVRKRLNTEKRGLILWLNTIFYDLRIDSILLDVNEK